MNSYLIIQKMHVTEVSMESSPITSGFPSIPAVMGFVHALQRKIQALHPGIQFPQTGISSHSFIPGVHQIGGGVKVAFSKNPPHARKHVEINSDGAMKGVPFIEEGKADMVVSIIIKIGEGLRDGKALAQDVFAHLPGLRLAGGKIWGAKKVIYQNCPDTEEDQRKILRCLMPGFVLVERKDLIEKSMEDGLDALDAILDHLEISRAVEEDDQGTESVHWRRKSKEPGWLVPISVGYHGISELGHVFNQRDSNCLHSFAENVISLGEFMMPLRLDRVESLLWKSNVDEKRGLYLYTQSFQTTGE
jgi:CRISPR-associated protein Csy2